MKKVIDKFAENKIWISDNKILLYFTYFSLLKLNFKILTSHIKFVILFISYLFRTSGK